MALISLGVGEKIPAMNKEPRKIGSLLLCSRLSLSTGNEKVSSASGGDIRIVQMNSAVKCMSEATLGAYDLIAVVIERDNDLSSGEFLALCGALKSNRLTCNTPVLAVLNTRNPGLLRQLDQAGADYVLFLPEESSVPSLDLLLETAGRLDASNMPRLVLEKVCPYIHYTWLQSGKELVSCGAYNDMLVLGKQKINGFCTTLEHRTCPFFLAPKADRLLELESA